MVGYAGAGYGEFQADFRTMATPSKRRRHFLAAGTVFCIVMALSVTLVTQSGSGDDVLRGDAAKKS